MKWWGGRQLEGTSRPAPPWLWRHFWHCKSVGIHYQIYPRSKMFRKSWIGDFFSVGGCGSIARQAKGTRQSRKAAASLPLLQSLLLLCRFAFSLFPSEKTLYMWTRDCLNVFMETRNWRKEDTMNLHAFLKISTAHLIHLLHGYLCYQLIRNVSVYIWLQHPSLACASVNFEKREDSDRTKKAAVSNNSNRF